MNSKILIQETNTWTERNFSRLRCSIKDSVELSTSATLKLFILQNVYLSSGTAYLIFNLVDPSSKLLFPSLLPFQVFLFLSFLSKPFFVSLNPGLHRFPIADLRIVAVENSTDRRQKRCPHNHCWSSSWQQPNYTSGISITRHDLLLSKLLGSIVVSSFLIL